MEDLEVKVPVLEKECQQMEAEGQSMAEQLSHSTDRQKGMLTTLLYWWSAFWNVY